MKNKIIPEHLKNIEKRMKTLNEDELLTLKGLLEKLTYGTTGGKDIERV